SYFAYDASRARERSARATLEAAQTVRASAEARFDHGLVPETDVLLARQEEARAAFDLEAAHGDRDNTYAALCESGGIPPTRHLEVAPFGGGALPALSAPVERLIDVALASRPDLAARLAALRARDAELQRARAEFFPTVKTTDQYGAAIGGYRAGPPF